MAFMKSSLAIVGLCAALPGLGWAGAKGSGGPLKNTDRIILLGGGFVEQERLHCFLEARLLRRHADGQLVLRNLGWGGDTVRGAARTGGFQNPEGFARLLKEVKQWKPTVILIGYGMNESFAGKSGLDGFTRDYGTLLDKLGPLGTRIVLLSPTYHEPLGHAYPDPKRHNDELELYVEAIRALADKRGLEFIDLFTGMKSAKNAEPTRVFTTNGIQPNADGYALVARRIEQALGYPNESAWRIICSAEGDVAEVVGVMAAAEKTKRGLKISIKESLVRIPDGLGKDAPVLRVTGLAKGEYVLEFEGKGVARGSAEDWARGMILSAGPTAEAGDRLRQGVIDKGEVFYRRWRPFNDHSRHFDFMKGDFSLYDKEIETRERGIRALLSPRSYVFEVVPTQP